MGRARRAELRKAGFGAKAERWAVGHLSLELQRARPLLSEATWPTQKSSTTRRRSTEAPPPQQWNVKDRKPTGATSNARKLHGGEQETAKLESRAGADRNRNPARGIGAAKPARHGKRARNLSGAGEKPTTGPRTPPDHLRGTSAEIWLAYHGSDNAKAFAAALDEKGIALAVVTREEAEESRKQNTMRARRGPFFQGDRI